MTPTAADLAAVALAAARAGAAAIQASVARGNVAAEFMSGQHDMVTAADRASEAAVLNVVRTHRPDDEIVAEETGQHPGTTDIRWLVDPLDGTANFVYGRTAYAVSVAAQRDGRHLAGAIVRPADGRWVAGADGRISHGTDDQAIDETVPAISDKPLNECLIAIGLPYPQSDRQRTLRAIADIIPMLRGIRIIGSAASDLADVATGRCDRFIGFGLAPWDTAAGEAIVEAQGGAVARLQTSWHMPVLVAGSVSLTDRLTDHFADSANPSPR